MTKPIADVEVAFGLLGQKQLDEREFRFGTLIDDPEAPAIEVQPLGWDKIDGGPLYESGDPVLHPIDPVILPALKQKIEERARADQKFEDQHRQPSIKTTRSAWD